MTVYRGRLMKVDGHTYTWRLSAAKGKFVGTCSKYATFTAQSAEAHGSLLRAKLMSKSWTKDMDLDDDLTLNHKVSFTPKDAEKAIVEARSAGWDPTKKGASFELPSGVDFEEYAT